MRFFIFTLLLISLISSSLLCVIKNVYSSVTFPQILALIPSSNSYVDNIPEDLQMKVNIQETFIYDGPKFNIESPTQRIMILDPYSYFEGTYYGETTTQLFGTLNVSDFAPPSIVYQTQFTIFQLRLFQSGYIVVSVIESIALNYSNSTLVLNLFLPIHNNTQLCLYNLSASSLASLPPYSPPFHY
jgi:hypothetical protein